MVDGATEELFVGLGELSAEQFCCHLIEGGVTEPDRDLPALALVAHRHLTLDGHVGCGALAHERHRLFGEFGEHLVGAIDVEVDG